MTSIELSVSLIIAEPSSVERAKLLKGRLEESAELSNRVVRGHWEVGKDRCHVSLLGQTTLNLFNKKSN